MGKGQWLHSKKGTKGDNLRNEIEDFKIVWGGGWVI